MTKRIIHATAEGFVGSLQLACRLVVGLFRALGSFAHHNGAVRGQ